MNACVRLCVSRMSLHVGLFVRMFSSYVTNITWVLHTWTCTHTHTQLCTLCSPLMPIYQTVDNESQHLCFQLVFVSCAFILMEPSECEGNMLLDRASFTLWFCFAVSEADRLCWTQGELIHSTDHALWSTSSLWGAQTALLKMAK